MWYSEILHLPLFNLWFQKLKSLQNGCTRTILGERMFFHKKQSERSIFEKFGR